jgi:glycosyltransferase involved in cell wall biosynthesis
VPRISVIMPTYGQAAFLRRAIASLQAQTLADWELIIVNDGSPDDTAAIVAGLAPDPRIVYLELAENRGVGAALNIGVERAQAPLIAYLPSDDLFYPEHLATLVAALDENPAAVLAFSGARHRYTRCAEGQVEG